MWELIKKWDSSYQFIYASQGVEVTGFGDEAHIRYLLDDDHGFDNGALLGRTFFENYCIPFTPYEKGWKSLGVCFQQRKLGDIIE